MEFLVGSVLGAAWLSMQQTQGDEETPPQLISASEAPSPQELKEELTDDEVLDDIDDSEESESDEEELSYPSLAPMGVPSGSAGVPFAARYSMLSAEPNEKDLEHEAYMSAFLKAHEDQRNDAKRRLEAPVDPETRRINEALEARVPDRVSFVGERPLKPAWIAATEAPEVYRKDGRERLAPPPQDVTGDATRQQIREKLDFVANRNKFGTSDYRKFAVPVEPERPGKGYTGFHPLHPHVAPKTFRQEPILHAFKPPSNLVEAAPAFRDTVDTRTMRSDGLVIDFTGPSSGYIRQGAVRAEHGSRKHLIENTSTSGAVSPFLAPPIRTAPTALRNDDRVTSGQMRSDRSMVHSTGSVPPTEFRMKPEDALLRSASLRPTSITSTTNTTHPVHTIIPDRTRVNVPKSNAFDPSQGRAADPGHIRLAPDTEQIPTRGPSRVFQMGPVQGEVRQRDDDLSNPNPLYRQRDTLEKFSGGVTREKKDSIFEQVPSMLGARVEVPMALKRPDDEGASKFFEKKMIPSSVRTANAIASIPGPSTKPETIVKKKSIESARALSIGKVPDLIPEKRIESVSSRNDKKKELGTIPVGSSTVVDTVIKPRPPTVSSRLPKRISLPTVRDVLRRRSIKIS